MAFTALDRQAPAPALIRELRTLSGLKQAELARRAGMPRSVLNAYERGHRQPGADALARIAAAAGFDLTLTPRCAAVDSARASRLLEQVLELAEALPFRAREVLEFGHLPTLPGGAVTAP